MAQMSADVLLQDRSWELIHRLASFFPRDRLIRDAQDQAIFVDIADYSGRSHEGSEDQLSIAGKLDLETVPRFDIRQDRSVF